MRSLRRRRRFFLFEHLFNLVYLHLGWEANRSRFEKERKRNDDSKNILNSERLVDTETHVQRERDGWIWEQKQRQMKVSCSSWTKLNWIELSVSFSAERTQSDEKQKKKFA